MIPANKTTVTASIRNALIVLLLIIGDGAYSQAVSQKGFHAASYGGIFIDNKIGVIIYTDNVIFEQENMKITADKATVEFNEKNETEKIITQGSPATFQLDPGKNKPSIFVSGDVIEYEIIDGVEIVLILGHANFKQGGTISKCDRYEINITAQTSSGSDNCEAVWMPLDATDVAETPATTMASSNLTTVESQLDTTDSQ